MNELTECWGAGSGGAEPEGVEPRGAESEGAESGGAEPRGPASSGGLARACLDCPRRAGDTGAGGVAITIGAGGTGGTAATGPGGARTSGAGAAGTGGVGCAGVGDPTERGATSARGAGAGVAGVGGFPSSLALSLTRLAGSFTTPPRAVSSLLRTSRSTSRFPSTGPAPSGGSQVDPLPGVQVVVVPGASPGAASGGAEPGGAGSEGAGSGGAKPEGVEPGGAESEGAESGGAEPRGAATSGGPAGASPRLSSQQLREWLVQRPHRRSGSPGAGETRDTGAGGAAVTTRAGDPTEPGAAGAGGAGAGLAGVGGPGARGAGAAGARAVDPGAGGAGGTVRLRPYFVPLLQQSGRLTEHREPVSCPVSPVCTARRTPRSCPPPVPGTHTMGNRPSSVPLRVPLPAPPESSLPEVPDLESDGARAACPTVAHLLPTAVTDPSFESAAASALVA
ncbi:unnamed protein product [Closterium sp. NIES-54]